MYKPKTIGDMLNTKYPKVELSWPGLEEELSKMSKNEKETALAKGAVCLVGSKLIGTRKKNAKKSSI